MLTLLKASLSSALAGLLGLDSVQAGQFLLSRPAFVGPVLGWLNGCPLEGARLGILLELLYIDFIPVGGVVPPNGTAAAAVAVMSHAAGLAPSLAFFFGLAAGSGFSPLEYKLRAIRSGWNSIVEKRVAAGDLDLGKWLFLSLFMEGAALAAYTAAWTGFAALAARLPVLPWAYPGTDFAFSLMPWLGLSGLYFRFRTQARKRA